MNQGKYVFAQVSCFLPVRVFDRCVAKFGGNKWIKHFTCYNQLMCMMFGQLSGRDSLRDLLVTISAHSKKYYHLGFGKNVSRSNLAAANEQRDFRIYESFAYEMIALARKCTVTEADFNLVIEGNVYAFDSTTIDLCLSVFWWADFRKTKGGIKLHTLYDVKTSIPTFVHITSAKVNDINILDVLTYEPGGYYVMDRGYIDFERLFKIHKSKAFFVTRARNRFHFNRIDSAKINKSTGVMCDQTIQIGGFYPLKKYPEKLRRIKFYDSENQKTLVFITNNFTLEALDITMLYKYRWKVELFFKWIKQHLKIKSFWGNSENAVKTQVYIAIITYTLIAIIKSKLKIDRSNYEILQILSASLFDKTDIRQLLKSPIYSTKEENEDYQLKINLN